MKTLAVLCCLSVISFASDAAEEMTFRVWLEPFFAVPPNASTARGDGFFRLNGHQLTGAAGTIVSDWKMESARIEDSQRNLVATSSHILEDIVIDGESAPYSISRTVAVFDLELPEHWRQELLSGHLFVSIPSPSHPNGEIRGKIVGTPDPSKRPGYQGVLISPGLEVVKGDTLSISVSATGDPAPLYYWKKDGMALEGQYSSNLVIRIESSDDAGVYQAVATNPSGSDKSPGFHIRYFETAAARLTQPQIISGTFSFSVPQVKNKRYIVSQSNDLKTWSPLLTNTAPFEMTNLPTSRWRRFYRAELVE